MVRRRLEKMMGLVMVRESSGGARQRERTYEPGTAAADSQHSLPVSEASQSQSQSSHSAIPSPSDPAEGQGVEKPGHQRGNGIAQRPKNGSRVTRVKAGEGPWTVATRQTDKQVYVSIE
jgi:hypothetical protein